MSCQLIIIPISALFITQAIKLSIDKIKGNFTWYHLAHDYGGMPSSHSALICALLTEIALVEQGGIKSPLFAAVFIFGILKIRDAKGLRNYLSQTNKELNKLTANQPKLNERIGHTNREIAVGCLLGIIIGFIGVLLI
ncbi:MAG: divergent PAP2 family protein [bacterium]